MGPVIKFKNTNFLRLVQRNDFFNQIMVRTSVLIKPVNLLADLICYHILQTVTAGIDAIFRKIKKK